MRALVTLLLLCCTCEAGEIMAWMAVNDSSAITVTEKSGDNKIATILEPSGKLYGMGVDGEGRLLYMSRSSDRVYFHQYNPTTRQDLKSEVGSTEGLKETWHFSAGYHAEKNLLVYQYADRLYKAYPGKPGSTVQIEKDFEQFKLSPDGSKVVLTRFKEGKTGSHRIFVLDIASGITTDTQQHAQFENSVSWLNPQTLLYTLEQKDGDKRRGYIVAHELGKDGFTILHSGRWPVASPDGKKIAFEEDLGEGVPWTGRNGKLSVMTVPDMKVYEINTEAVLFPRWETICWSSDSKSVCAVFYDATANRDARLYWVYSYEVESGKRAEWYADQRAIFHIYAHYK